MTRLLGKRVNSQVGGDALEVLVHLDSSVFFVREYGNFISHIASNHADVRPLRNFTCDTIPFSVKAVRVDEPSAEQPITFPTTEDTFNP